MDLTDKTDAGVNGIIGSETTWIKTFCNDYATNFSRAGLWYDAMMELKPSAFKIWMYCATDAPNKELTPKLMEQLFGMGRTTYYDGITDLKDKGYLIENNGLFVFSIDKDWTK
nr:MAG TPA: MarR family [Caudoviricetes sp.]